MNIPRTPATGELRSMQNQKSSPPKRLTALTVELLAWSVAVAVAATALCSAWLRGVVMHGVNGMGDFPLIDCFHAFAVAHEYRAGAEAQAPLQRLMAVVMTALGGTTMVQ